MMSQKRSTILVWAAVIFALLIVCLITDRNNLAERTLYSSQEEMQSALQGTFVSYTSRGERKTWRIHDDTAIQTYGDGVSFSYTITKWHPHRGALTLTLDTTTQKESLFVSPDGSLFDQHNHVFQREEQSDNTDKSVNRKSVSAQSKPIEQEKPSEQNQPAQTDSKPVYTAPRTQRKIEEMPDCDDYESYEDFMDDWDGYMPDGMMGLVVGDALGCPVQFLEREELRERGAVTEMEGYGTYNMPPGTWTDDSSMALATLASINEQNRIDLQDIMERFLDWEFHGAYTPFGEAFDEGNTCSNAIYKYRDDHNLETCGETDEYSNGNGALMRILPVCLYFIQKEDISDADVLRQIHLATGLTHNHLRCHIASGLYYFMAKAIVTMAPKKAELKTCIQRGLEQGFAFYHKPENLAELMHFQRLRDLSEFFSLPEDEIQSDGYVVHSLEAAVWCLLHTNSFRDCLLRAVNLGDDTDTTAAIAGGLAGLYYHYEAMPAEWLDAIQKRAWIEELCLNQ